MASQPSVPSSGTLPPGTSSVVASRPPRAAHVVVVVLENHAYGQVIGSARAPFLNSLAARDATFTRFDAITHPSEPNYLALFSGSTHELTSDACPVSYGGANVAHSLLKAGKTFTGYAEGLPRGGFTGCGSGDYTRRHAPWISFTNVPASSSQPMSLFPGHYSSLPTVSFVIPNLQHDMHDGAGPMQTGGCSTTCPGMNAGRLGASSQQPAGRHGR